MPVDRAVPATRCSGCHAANEAVRNRRMNRAVLCAGTCGELIAGGTTSLPAGQRMCRPCRRAQRSASYVPRGPIGCANVRCQATITAPRPTQRFCSKACRQRVGDPTGLAKARNARKNDKRRPDHAYGHAWQQLRARVLVEESHCWICEDPIEPAIRWPDPMAGTGDHVVPLEGGGRLLDRDNVRAAHNVCNRERHIAWRRERRAALRAA